MYVYIRLGCGRLTPKITDRKSLIVGVLAMRARLTWMSNIPLRERWVHKSSHKIYRTFRSPV